MKTLFVDRWENGSKINFNPNILLRNILYTPPLSGEKCSAIIRSVILDRKPAMVARFGSTEIKAVLYPQMPSAVRCLLRSKVFYSMKNLSGFFSISNDGITKFSRLMIEDMKLLDVLGSWRVEEKLLLKHFPNAKRIDLKGLEPYYSIDPWSKALEGLRVLVVHPFDKTIRHQYYNNRERLFSDKRILPKFKELETVKAEQTIAGNQSVYSDWFEALEAMKAAVDLKEYDVAILGCGAYGFPLAAHVKRQGKIAIHLGGGTQILFGIKGRRWDTHPVISSFYNDSWVRPSPEEIPIGANKVESGCYW
ncbi:hypothetical protein ACFL0S_07820 [Thermodesulfobacteriota bacterium]